MPEDSAPTADWDDAASEAQDPAETLRPGVMAALLLVLPMYGQIFYYMKGLLPLWALSKAFPLLSLPMAGILLRHPSMPMYRQVILTFCWLMLAPSILAIHYFHQDFFVGLGAQVKLLPMLYYFSFLGLLLYLQPNLHEIASAFIISALATYAVLLVLWALVPESAYVGSYSSGQTPMFTSDNRGHRIHMPMYFGIIAIFYFFRRFQRSGHVGWLLGAIAGFVMTLGLVKTRAMVVGIVGVVIVRGFLGASKAQRFLLALTAPAAVIGMFSFGYLKSMFSTEAGSGLDVRWKTLARATSFLGTDSVRWIFGVGTISPTNTDSLFSYFDHFFFLGDITWLGVVFEFGIVGAILFVLYDLRGMLFYQTELKTRLDSDFLGSLADYLFYVLVISQLYPPTLTPGETAVILAIFTYVWQWLKQYDAEQASAL